MIGKIFDWTCRALAIGVSILILGGMLYGVYFTILEHTGDVLLTMGIMASLYMFIYGVDLLIQKWAKI